MPILDIHRGSGHCTFKVEKYDIFSVEFKIWAKTEASSSTHTYTGMQRKAKNGSPGGQGAEKEPYSK